MSGWFKMPRKVAQVCEGNPPAAAVALQIGRRIRFEAGYVVNKHGDSVYLNVGECVIGFRDIAVRCGITVSQARSATAYLQKHKLIALSAAHRGTVVRALWLSENDDNDEGESHTGSHAASHSDSHTASHAGPHTASQLSRMEKKKNKKGKEGEDSQPPLASLSDLEEAKRHWDKWWTEAAGTGADWTPAIEEALRGKLEQFGLEEVKYRFDCAENDPPPWPETRDIDTVLTFFDKFTRGVAKKKKPPRIPTAGSHRKLDDLDAIDRKNAVADLKKLLEAARTNPTTTVVEDLRDMLEKAERIGAIDILPIGDEKLVRDECGQSLNIPWELLCA